MNQLELDAFLELPWSDNVRHVLRAKVWRDDVIALAAVDADGRLVAQAWSRWPRPLPTNLVAVWCKRAPPAKPKRKPRAKPAAAPAELPPNASRTAQAVALVDQGMTAYQAARQLGIQQSAVSRALSRRAARRVCPTCSQVIRPAPASA